MTDVTLLITIFNQTNLFYSILHSNNNIQTIHYIVILNL